MIIYIFLCLWLFSELIFKNLIKMAKGLFDFFQLMFLKEKPKLNKHTEKMNILFNIILLVSLLSNESSSSKINLIISGDGLVNILSDSFSLDPSEVIVNGLSKGTSCQKTCELNGDQNNVTLIFDEQIETCNYMFSGLENIKQKYKIKSKPITMPFSRHLLLQTTLQVRIQKLK